MRMLIVEDDHFMARSLLTHFRTRYVVDGVRSISKANEYMHTYAYDIVILDMALPDGNGISLCREWRHQKVSTPILVLTGRANMDDRLASFEAGADDYVTKPFNLEELQLRVNALSKRANSPLLPTILKVGSLVLDTNTNEVTFAGKKLDLRRKGILILEYLMRHVGYIVSREMLAEHIWESEHDPMSNTIDVHIRYLRSKIDIPFGTQMIKTVHGFGYMLEKKK